MTAFFFSSLTLALATPTTLVLLGHKWEPVSAIFAGFTFTAIQLPLTNAANWLLTSQGRGRDILHVASINCFPYVSLFHNRVALWTAGCGDCFLAIGLLVRLPILYYVAGGRGPVTTFDLWTRFLRHLPLWVVMFGRDLVDARYGRRICSR